MKVNIKRVVLLAIAGITIICAFLCMLTPLLKYDLYGVTLYSVNGFDALSFNNFFLNNICGSVIGIIAGVVSITIIAGTVICLAYYISCAIKPDGYKELSVVMRIAWILSFIYVILTIAILIRINKNNHYSEYTTLSYIMFFVCTVLDICFTICSKRIKENFTTSVPGRVPNNGSNTYINISESERLSMILKYKELLNQEIITKEEFEIKKRELLLLNDTRERNVPYSEMTEDDDTIQIVIRYKQLVDEGLISEEEFAELKKKLL